MTLCNTISFFLMATILSLAMPGQAQELQRTSYRLVGSSASAEARASGSCEQTSVSIGAFESVRREGPGGSTHEERLVSVTYSMQNWCEGTILQFSAQLPAQDTDLPASLRRASVSLSASVSALRCSFSTTPHCANVTVPLALQVTFHGDPEQYSVSRTSYVSRIGNVLTTNRSRGRIVAAEAELSLQVDGRAMAADHLSAYLQDLKDGTLIVEELARDPGAS